jgi:streptogramin lyase
MYTNPGYGYCDNATSSPNHISKSGIRYDILKLLYAGMLLGFTPDKVRQFWKEHPLPQIKPENESHVFKELLQGRSWYSTEYAFSVFNDVEDFLIENGTSFPEFIENSF